MYNILNLKCVISVTNITKLIAKMCRLFHVYSDTTKAHKSVFIIVKTLFM